MQKNPEKAALLAHFSADRRYAAMLGLGFSAGIPYLLVYATQSAWLSEANVPIETIGLMSELTIAYKFKFVWGAVPRQIRRANFQRASGAPARLDRRLADRGHAGARRRRLRRSG
jgi:hypothetical protein